MKQKTLYKIISRILLSSVALLCFNFHVFASSSSSFSFDFDGIVTGSEKYTSDSYEIQSGPLPLETNSNSSSYQIATINLIPYYAPICGNGIKEAGEECDTSDFNGLTCLDYGFRRGSLSCTATCTIDTSNCSKQRGIILFEEEPEVPPEVPPEIPPEIPPKIPPEVPPEIPEIPPEIIEKIPPEIFVEIPPEILEIIPEKVPKEVIPEEILEWKNTIDDTLFIADTLEPNSKYRIYITKYLTGELIETVEIQTDINGNFVYEYRTIVEDGLYLMLVFDEKEQFVKNYYFNLKERDEIQFRVVDFADKKAVINDFNNIVDLGAVSVFKNRKIIGRGTPNAEVISYFATEEILIRKTIIDENGYYEIEIPDSLQLGKHTLYILQIYPDQTWSKNLTYTFNLGIADKGIGVKESKFLMYVILLILILIIILYFVHWLIIACLNRNTRKKPKKKQKKKTRHKKSKRFISKFMILVLIIASVPIGNSTASAPQLLLYEGRLLDNTGTVITTAHTFRFSFWSSGDLVAGDIDGAGNINAGAPNYAGWQEEHTITPNSNGTFSIKLGSINPLPVINYAIHKFLQVEIKPQGTPNTSYELMDPTGDNGVDTNDRKTIASVPFALNTEAAQFSYDETFTIDMDNTVETAGTGSIELKFGDTLSKILSYDTDNNYFNFNDSVNIEGNLTLSGTVDGVDISNLQFSDIASRVIEQVFVSEYDGATLMGDGTNNRGKMEAESVDLGGSNKLNYYRWTTQQLLLQDIDIVISYTLPLDFVSFTATPLRVNYRTSDGNTGTNKIDISLFDANGNPVTLTGGSNLANANWTTANITFGGAPTFTAGQPITLYLKLSATSAGFAETADIVFEYNGR